MSKADELAVVIRRKGGKVVASIPQLGLFAAADDVNGALAAIEAKKVAFIADLEAAGELDALEVEDWSLPSRQVTTSKSDSGLGRFALKAGIVACIVVAIFVVSGVLIASKVEQSVANTVNNVKSIKIGGAQFWSRVEGELDRMASAGADLPEAKRKKLLADIHAIAEKWRPFLVEVQAALTNPNNPPRSEGAASPK